MGTGEDLVVVFEKGFKNFYIAHLNSLSIIITPMLAVFALLLHTVWSSPIVVTLTQLFLETETTTAWETQISTQWSTISAMDLFQTPITAPALTSQTFTSSSTEHSTSTVTKIVIVTASSTASLEPTSGLPAQNGFEASLLRLHNNKRSLHHAPAMAWNNTLQKYAQQYADKYDCSGVLTHSKGPYGENLAIGYNTSGALQAWYDEYKLYDYNKPGFSEQTGHFTQVVWKKSTQVGCGYKDCGNYYGQYTICSYFPPGNFKGEFEENVLA